MTLDGRPARAPQGPAVLLVNPTAGGGSAGCIGRQAVHTLAGYGAEAVLVAPESAGDLPAAVMEACHAARERGTPAGMLVAVGGDGTVRLAAGLAAGLNLPIGIIPAGTGNGIAYSLGLPLDAWEACRVVAGGAPSACDLGLIEDVSGRGDPPLRFVNVCGAGLDAVISQTYHEDGLGVRGMPGYAIAAVRSLAAYHPFPVELAIDGERHTLEALLVAFGNGAFYGKGVRIAPLADPYDGLLDVCVVLPVSLPELSGLIPMLLLGWHGSHPRVRTFRAREVVVGVGPGGGDQVPVPVHADGDVVTELPVRVSVVPGGISFILPRTGMGCRVAAPDSL